MKQDCPGLLRFADPSLLKSALKDARMDHFISCLRSCKIGSVNQWFFRIAHRNEFVGYTPTWLPEDPPLLRGLFRDTKVDIILHQNIVKTS